MSTTYGVEIYPMKGILYDNLKAIVAKDSRNNLQSKQNIEYNKKYVIEGESNRDISVIFHSAISEIHLQYIN